MRRARHSTSKLPDENIKEQFQGAIDRILTTGDDMSIEEKIDKFWKGNEEGNISPERRNKRIKETMQRGNSKARESRGKISKLNIRKLQKKSKDIT